jgi:glycosyltransferase involved in cell wall biosynthesis
MVITRAGATTLVSEALRAEAGGVLARAPVIPMGVDLVRFHPRFAVSACFSQWCGDRPVLLFVGRLVEKKGLSVLLRALTEPALKATGAHLVVVGDGPLRPRLETCREALGLHDRVHFLPPAGHGRLPALYASADVFCAPSVVAANGETDGLPAVILEASACATPSVSTPVGGITELIEDGVNGLLVPPGDHVALARAAARLINDDALRNRLGRAARDRVAAYGWSRIAARFDLLYRSVLAADEAAGER